jgi:hypothetical protein
LTSDFCNRRWLPQEINRPLRPVATSSAVASRALASAGLSSVKRTSFRSQDGSGTIPMEPSRCWPRGRASNWRACTHGFAKVRGQRAWIKSKSPTLNQHRAWLRFKFAVGELAFRALSREAAQECSPRGKAWVQVRDDSAPEGRKNSAAALLVNY